MRNIAQQKTLLRRKRGITVQDEIQGFKITRFNVESEQVFKVRSEFEKLASIERLTNAEVERKKRQRCNNGKTCQANKAVEDGPISIDTLASNCITDTKNQLTGKSCGSI